MTTNTIDAKLRQNARSAYRKELEKTFKPVFDATKSNAIKTSLVCEKGECKMSVPDTATGGTRIVNVLSVHQCLHAALDNIFSQFVELHEQSAIEAFMKKVDGLQEQLDELRETTGN